MLATWDRKDYQQFLKLGKASPYYQQILRHRHYKQVSGYISGVA